MSAESPTPQEIDVWITSVRDELDQLASDLAPLLTKREQLKRRLELLERLRESLDLATAEPASARRQGDSDQSVRQYVIARATELLDEEAGPLHINELHARFLARGFEVPGAGAPVNITSHIRHADHIVSPKRGVYALSKYTDTGRSGT